MKTHWGEKVLALMRALLAMIALIGMTWLMLSTPVMAFELRKAGRLQVPHAAQLFAFSTDPMIQEVLSQDFGAAHRAVGAGSGPTLTVSVNVSQQMLKPGISLNDLAPGDPQVADLIAAAGASPPPVGDTGDQYDEAALARRMAQQNLMPQDTAAEQMIRSMSQPGGGNEGFGVFRPPIPLPCAAQTVAAPGCPPVPASSATSGSTNADSHSVGDIKEYLDRKKHGGLFGSSDNKNYDTVIVARASVSGSTEEMTVVAVVHPGEDVNDAKKEIAEEVANAILR